MKKHKCVDGHWGDGTGYNGSWCKECGSLFYTNNGNTRELLWKPLGIDPKKCKHSCCMEREEFEDAVLVRVEGTKYCPECGSIFSVDDRNHGNNQITIHHPKVSYGKSYYSEQLKREADALKRYEQRIAIEIADIKKERDINRTKANIRRRLVKTHLNSPDQAARIKKFKEDVKVKKLVQNIKDDIQK